MYFGMNWTEAFRNVSKIKKKKRLMEEIHSEILLKLNGSMPRLLLAFIFAQRYKIHYIQLGKIFDICHILYFIFYIKYDICVLITV